MKIKKVKSVKSDKIICPICKKDILNYDATKPVTLCSHVLAWITSSDQEILFANKTTKKKLIRHFETVEKIAGYVPVSQSLASFYSNTPNVSIIEFNLGYLGGCIEDINLIAFKK